MARKGRWNEKKPPGSGKRGRGAASPDPGGVPKANRNVVWWNYTGNLGAGAAKVLLSGAHRLGRTRAVCGVHCGWRRSLKHEPYRPQNNSDDFQQD